MTETLAIARMVQRMKDLGYGSDYYWKFRHFALAPNETLELDAHNQVFILLEEIAEITINSDLGLYDLSNSYLGEQSHEHQGNITLANTAAQKTHIRFLQVIPKNQNT